MEFLLTLANILDGFVTFLIYFVIGFGPGFITGVLLANRIFGKNLPLRMQKNKESIKKAAEHNSQWHPNNPKWK